MPEKFDPRDLELKRIKIILILNGCRTSDIAKSAGVTVGTASNVINGRHHSDVVVAAVDALPIQIGTSDVKRLMKKVNRD